MHPWPSGLRSWLRDKGDRISLCPRVVASLSWQHATPLQLGGGGIPPTFEGCGAPLCALYAAPKMAQGAVTDRESATAIRHSTGPVPHPTSRARTAGDTRWGPVSAGSTTGPAPWSKRLPSWTPPEGGGGGRGAGLHTSDPDCHMPTCTNNTSTGPCDAPPPPPCAIPSRCCSFTGPWTVTRSSLRMLRRVAAFCRPLRPVLLLVSFPRL